LRIEDIDTGRCRSEYEAWILEDLGWLGVTWEEPVRRQSQHFSDYAASLQTLQTLGLVYPCFASRKEIAVAAQKGSAVRDVPHDPDGTPIYPGIFRNADPAEITARMASGTPYALRLDMAKALKLAREKTGGPLSFVTFRADGTRQAAEASPERWGDVVLARSDRPASYHLAVVTDDALQGVTHITRGTDMLAATDIHRLLQALLDLPPPLYCHHRLILDPAGRKLSKSARDQSLRALRRDGATPDAIRIGLGFTADGFFVEK
jgi:glutamyl-Q tRNA(Asp) synthetase